MTKEFFREVLTSTLKSIEETMGVKAMEYMRHNNPMHNFEVAARISASTREKALFGMALKHHVSIADMRNDIEKGIYPTKEQINEKFGDAINYLILEKASMLDTVSHE